MQLVNHFFFQAEDGIRDADVTGVQTCALPISKRLASLSRINKSAKDRSRSTYKVVCSVSKPSFSTSSGIRVIRVHQFKKRRITANSKKSKPNQNLIIRLNHQWGRSVAKCK